MVYVEVVMNIGPFNSNVFNGVQMEPELAPMKTGKAKGWGMEYHWVEQPVTEQNKHMDRVAPAKDWCIEHFGKSGVRWFEKQQKFYFKDERDMTLFILRWS